MAWVRLDDSHQDHPKIAPISDRAYRLWVRAIAYSNRFGLNGDLTASQLRLIRVPIRAKMKHETELIGSGLWRKTDAGICVHDIGDYQPSASKAAEISSKRSEAGKRGAEARWGTDSNLPSAENAPVPSRPDPTRPDPEREIDLSNMHDDTEVRASEVELLGAQRYGRIGGSVMTKIARLSPMRGWEIKHAMASPGRSWAYFAKVVESVREEAQRPTVNSGPKPRPRSAFREATEAAMAIAQQEDMKNADDRVRSVDDQVAGLLPERNR